MDDSIGIYSYRRFRFAIFIGDIALQLTEGFRRFDLNIDCEKLLLVGPVNHLGDLDIIDNMNHSGINIIAEIIFFFDFQKVF